jgi:hypothetical protein
MADGKKVLRKSSKSTPRGVIFFTILFAIFPFIIYFFYSLQYEIPLLEPWKLILVMDPVSLVLIFLPFIVAFGIFKVQKWGLFLFFGYAAIFTGLHFYKAMLNPSKFNFATIGFVQLFFVAIFYFIREQVRKPFLDKSLRGFRVNERIPLELEMQLNDSAYFTKEMSGGGAMLIWSNCELKEHQELQVTFHLGSKKYQMRAGIAWKSADYVGIAFRGQNKKSQKQLNHELMTYF